MNAELQDIFIAIHSCVLVQNCTLCRFMLMVRAGLAISTELVPVIENTSLFAEFLGKLQPEDVQNEGAEIFLSDVVANFIKVVGLC